MPYNFASIHQLNLGDKWGNVRLKQQKTSLVRSEILDKIGFSQMRKMLTFQPVFNETARWQSGTYQHYQHSVG